MKRIISFLLPSLLSLPTYLGLIALFLIPSIVALFLTAKIQEPPTGVNTRAAEPMLSQPMGKIIASKTAVTNLGDTVTFTAQVQPKEGVIEYVRYYLLNPTLSAENDWGNPNWCSCSQICTQYERCTMKTWDLGESSDFNRGYAISWGPDTTSGLSTQVSRRLNPQNIPPGVYEVFMQVKDTAGNLNQAADSIKITVTSGNVAKVILGASTIAPLHIETCGQDEGAGVRSFTFADDMPTASNANYRYQIDQGEWLPLQKPGIVLSIPGGGHLFTIESNDSTGPIAIARCTFTTE